MKKLLATLAILSLLTATHAQNARTDPQGNFVALKPPEDTAAAIPTGKTFTDLKGQVYPVMETKKGKYYYIRTSRNGTQYKAYLKLEGDDRQTAKKD